MQGFVLWLLSSNLDNYVSIIAMVLKSYLMITISFIVVLLFMGIALIICVYFVILFL